MEVLRDTIIFASMIATLAYYCWLIPPPLHVLLILCALGFVFPDWYVLFSYGYLRWGEYLPSYTISAGPIGAFFMQNTYFGTLLWGLQLQESQ